MNSVEMNKETLVATDATILVTDHETVDYNFVLQHAPLVIDTRGVYGNGEGKVYPA
jgi:UDP-N-acetyl-D-glucosamine dehydrogenase